MDAIRVNHSVPVEDKGLNTDRTLSLSREYRIVDFKFNSLAGTNVVHAFTPTIFATFVRRNLWLFIHQKLGVFFWREIPYLYPIPDFRAGIIRVLIESL